MVNVRNILILALVGLGILAGGCSTLSPWERGTLARSDMQLAGAAQLAESEVHATQVREGSVGGFGAGGGGCGCN